MGIECGYRNVGQHQSQMTYKKPLASVTSPTLVEALIDYHIDKVSCGVSHTAAISIRQDQDQGGHVFVCGSAHVLGRYTPIFRKMDELAHVCAKDVSCGASHTAVVTTRGEVYTWGT